MTTISYVCYMYDIAWTLNSFEEIHADASIFHSCGHKMGCQVKYSPGRMSDIGLTDGESLERLWSYLGIFSNITKEMTPENRIDLLTDALLHYGRRIRDKLSVSLPGRMKKAVMLESSSRTSLQELLEPLTQIQMCSPSSMSIIIVYIWKKVFLFQTSISCS